MTVRQICPPEVMSQTELSVGSLADMKMTSRVEHCQFEQKKMFRNYYLERLTHQLRYPYHLLITTSPRKVLFAINLLLAILSLLVAGFACFLCSILYNPNFSEGMRLHAL
jgi:hypothetical protein